MELIAGENDDGRRLDRIIRKALPEIPLSLIHRLLRRKKILINGKPGKAPDLIHKGANIFIPISDSTFPAPDTFSDKSKKNENNKNNILDILFEDSNLIAVNKPAGISVHGENSLDTIVRSYLANKLPPSLSFTPGPLHRLDKPTSGIIVFSKDINGARLFSSLLRERKIKKTYLAIVKGALKKEVLWQDDLIRDKNKKKTFISKNKEDSKTAITKITPIISDMNLTLIKAEISTGRTHQIRAQAASHGFPLLGDVKYGSRMRNVKWGMRNGEWGMGNGERVMRNNNIANIYLHAWRLEFLEYFIEAPPPQTWSPIASRIASTNVLRSGSLPDIPGISTNRG